ncbi:MAG: two pore domain potassium channel family protein [Caldilinea sp. CFX5]|nr:two pore domain potassium channel family protein [Caldilinea sp. CFX5]
MISFVLILYQFWHALRIATNDAEFRSLGVIVGFLLLVGTIFYHQVEGWGWLDSLYFCVITLATVGYGDFSPQTAAGKIFTMIYILLGIGTLVAVLTRLADALAAARRERR